MNAKDKKKVHGYIDQLEEIKLCLKTMQEEETEKLDNMPEGLQESERGMKMEEAIEDLDAACASVEVAIGYLTDLAE